jgi:hypothetical protein
MSKQIILDALASQFAVKQSEFQQYTTTVHEPAIVKLNQSIHDWFSNVLTITPHDVKFHSDNLEITPSIDGKWPSTINIRKRYSFRDGENNYYEIDYRGSNNKVEDNNMYYLTTLGKIAQHINLITENIENEWKSAYKAIYNPYSELNSELYKLEQEINIVKQDIHNANREEYKVIGYEHTISPHIYCKMNYDTDRWELSETPYTFTLETGRGKWDYIHVNSYRVIGPAKYNKIALQYKRKDDENWIDIEVKYDYFDLFIEGVYKWETTGKAKRDADETERYNRYTAKAEQTS